MNDNIVEKTASSLVIVEKKLNKPGGCVGIFFQLFDWNRRFAKKKLFSKKLLQPVRLKKFGGDEKQGKLRLIADENSGGFPFAMMSNVDLEQNHEMRSPSLVARLMGLESIPTSSKEKLNKIRFDENDNCVDNVEKGGINKHAFLSRPQKLQKTTSVCETRAITRFGAENLSFKNVLSKSRNNHRSKLPSPVKNPRNFSRKNSCKLIGAATKILEPGLQTNRSKCALDYSKANPVLEEKTQLLPSQMKDFHEKFASLGNCGHFLENMESKPSFGERPLIFSSPFSQCVGSSCQESERSKPHKDVPYSLSSNNKNQSQSQHPIFRARDTFPPLSNLNRAPNNKVATASVINERKYSISGNQSLSGKFEPEKRTIERQNDTMPPGRKRRPSTISRQGENSLFMSSNVKKQTYGIYGKELGYYQSNRSGLPYLRERPIREVAKRRVQNNSSCDDFLQKPSISENDRTDRVQTPLPLSGDTLGALLEQKLKELNCQGEEITGNAPKKTTATILQELISALTSEMPFQRDKPVVSLYDEKSRNDKNIDLCNSTSSSNLQANARAVELPTDCSYHGPQSPNPDSELLDSANTSKQSVISILDDVSKTLTNFGLKEIKLNQTKKVFLNAELLGFPIKHFLLDELETLANILWMNFGCALGVEDGKEASHLKIFTFDSIIEYLDLRFETYYKVGSRKLPLCMNSSNVVILEIVKEVRRWEGLSKFVLDELIEREMSLSLGKWTQFESERFEIGIEISRDVFQILVDEIIRDFW